MTKKHFPGGGLDSLVAISISEEQTGTGGVQSIAHDLGYVPTLVLVALTGGPAAYSQPSIVEGTHTRDNVVVTVSADWKYRVIALV